MSEQTFECPSCGQQRDEDQQWPGDLVPTPVARAIQHEHPNWSPEMDVCLTCVNEGKAGYMEEMLEAEMGQLSELDRDVLNSIRTDTFLTPAAEAEMEAPETGGEHLAATVAKIIGSWQFLALILLMLLLWIAANLLFRPFEPYPIVMLAVISAVLASLAALEAPIIVMTQRRQQELDRERAINDYRVNLKAELEIRLLDEKSDLMLRRQRELMGQLIGLGAPPRELGGLAENKS